MRTQRFPSSVHRQRGAALVVGLIFLVLVTLIAVTAMSSTVLQERMTGGQRNESLALNGAESTLRGAELQLWDTYIASNGLAVPAGTLSLFENVTAGDAYRANATFGTGLPYSGVDYPGLPSTAGSGKLASAPNYQIERFSGIGDDCLETHCGGASSGGGVVGLSDWFRVTSKSQGGDPRVVRVAESVYAMGR